MATGDASGRVDVVIVTADTRDLTLACLDSLDDSAIERTIVVDNGSRDGTAEAVARLFPDVVLERLERPVGFAAANNRGARRGAAEHVLFLNSDVRAQPDAVSTMTAELERHPGAVAAGGRLVDPDALTTQHRYGPQPFPTLRTLVLRLWEMESRGPREPAPSGLDERTTVEVQQPAGACLLVSRAAFEDAGGFDERYWFWYEDVDLARRLHRWGSVLHVPTAVFRHVGAGSFRSWSREEGVRSMLHGIVHYGEAHLSRPGRAGLGVALVALGGGRAARLAVRRQRGPARAYADSVRAGMALLTGRAASPLAPTRHP